MLSYKNNGEPLMLYFLELYFSGYWKNEVNYKIWQYGDTNKTYYGCEYWSTRKSVCAIRYFLPSQIFEDKAEAYPKGALIKLL